MSSAACQPIVRTHSYCSRARAPHTGGIIRTFRHSSTPARRRAGFQLRSRYARGWLLFLSIMFAWQLAPFPTHGAEPPPAREFRIGTPSAARFHGPFLGFGAEWDPFYWNENNLRRGSNEAGWELITGRIRQLDLGIVRVMMQLFWVQGNPDLTEWDWDNPQARSLLRYLEFTREHGIVVILTDWGWSVSSDESIRLYERPSDERFARGIAAYLEELIVRRGFTNIQYLVVGNEPDNELARHYGFDEYAAMYRNVDQALTDAGLQDRVKLTGPDSGGHWSFMDAAIERLNDVLDAYDFHRYAGPVETAQRGVTDPWETLWTRLDRWKDEILKRDPSGAEKPLLLTEIGMHGGSTNVHPLIDTFEYGLHMADYGTTLLTTRVNAGIAWTLHDVYYFEYEQFMQWGMWQDARSSWAVRPWGQAFGLLIKHARPGSVQAPINGNPPAHPGLGPYRVAALVRPDSGWSIFLVNRDSQPACLTVVLPEAPAQPFELYRYDRETAARHGDALLLPPLEVLIGGRSLAVEVPPESFTVLAERTAPAVPLPSSPGRSSGLSSCS